MDLIQSDTYFPERTINIYYLEKNTCLLESIIEASTSILIVFDIAGKSTIIVSVNNIYVNSIEVDIPMQYFLRVDKLALNVRLN